MNINRFRAAAAIIGLIFMSGCVGYVSPYPQYSEPYGYGAPPAYGGYYNYGVYPVVPVPVFRGGWWGHGGYGHYRHH